MNSLLRLSIEQLLPLVGAACIYITFSVVPKGFLPEQLGGRPLDENTEFLEFPLGDLL